MRLFTLAISGLCFVLCETSEAAAPPRASSTCVACHGSAGVSSNDLWPNLAGQKRGYIQAQLYAFKNGQRVNELMSPIAKLLSETDISELSAYYSDLVSSAAVKAGK